MSNCDCPDCQARRAAPPERCDYCGGVPVVRMVCSRSPVERLHADRYVRLCAACSEEQHETIRQLRELEEKRR